MMADEFPAMGTTISVTAPDAAGIAATQRWFAEVEHACSRFLPHSNLSKLNDDPRPAVPVAGLLSQVLRRAAEIRDLTDGLVDAGVGSDVVRWGYNRTFDDVSGLAAAPAHDLGSRAWAVRDGMVTRPPGVRIDLGGIAKGWAADEAVRSGLARIVSAGGDLASSHPDCEVEVRGPAGNIVATVAVGIGALATSSVSRRRWRVGDDVAHHLIDPRTARPADTPVVSATVIAEHAVVAEAGAKAVLIRGADGLAWAGRQHWIKAAVVVWNDGAVYATSGLDLAA